MGKYDAIRGAGNVTVQAPPDFWTSAKQSFDDDYDRLVAAQERKNIKEQQDIDNNRAERQLNMQEDQAAMQKEAEERQKYMTELSMIENPTLRAEYAARHGVSKGWTPNEQVEEWKEKGIDKLRYETVRGQYLRGDDETKSLLRNRMRDVALEANAPATEFNMLEEIGNKAHSKQSMKVASNIALQFLPEEARTQIGSILKSGIEIDDNILGTIGTIFESTVKAAGTSNTRRIEGKQKMLLGVVEAIGKVDDTTPPLVVKTLNEWHTKLKNDPDIMGIGKVDDIPDLSDVPKPTLETFDDILTGEGDSYNALNQKRKLDIFNNVVNKHAANWDKMDSEQRIDAGARIEQEINKTSYDPDITVASFGGGEISDPEYKGVESLTDKVINDKIQEIYKRKGFTTKKKLNMMTDSMKTKSRKQAINELLSEKRYESKRKSKKIAREINKEMAERKRQEELMYGGGGF